MQQNASLSSLPCVISSVVWLQRDTLKVGSFKVRIRKKEKEGENEMKKRRVETENGWNKGCSPQRVQSRIEKLKDCVSCSWMERRREVGSREESSHWLNCGSYFWSPADLCIVLNSIQGNSKLQSHHFRDKSVISWRGSKIQRLSYSPNVGSLNTKNTKKLSYITRGKPNVKQLLTAPYSSPFLLIAR